MAKEIKGLTVKVDGDITGLKKAMSDATQEMRQTEKALQAVNKGLKLDPTNVNLVTQKQKLLTREIDDTEKALVELKKQQEAIDEKGADKTTASYSLLVAKIEECEQKLKDLNSQVSNLSPNAEVFLAKMDKVGDSLDTISTKTQGLSRAMTAVIGAAAYSAIDYEKDIANIQKVITDLTDETISNLKMIAVETGTSFDDISEIATIAGTLGIAEKDIDTFTKTMVDLKTATNDAISGEEGSKAVARFLNVLGIGTDQASNFGSALTYVGDKFAATVGEILEIATNMSGLATISGITADDIIGLSAEMKNLGLQSSSGASAITRTFLAIENSTATESDELEVFAKASGKSVKEFSKAWRDDAMSAFIEFVDGISTSEENAAKILDDVGLDGVRTAQVLLRLAGNGEVVKQAIEESNYAWQENEALTRKANTVYDTTANKLAGALEALKQMGAELLEDVLPAVQDATEHFKRLAEWFNNLSDSNKNLVLTFMTLGAGISPVTKVLSSLIKGGTSAVRTIAKMANTTSKLIPMISQLSSVFGLAGVGALAFGAYMAYQNNYVVQLDKSVKELTSNLKENSEEAQKNYLRSEVEIRSAQQYTDEIDNLILKLKDKNITEAEALETQEKIQSLVSSVNEALGGEYVAFDEATGKIIAQGEEVDNLTEKFNNLSFQAKKSAWESAHQEDLQQAYKMIEEANKNYSEILDNYIEVRSKYSKEDIEALEKIYSGESDLNYYAQYEKAMEMVDLANATNEYNSAIKKNNELLEAGNDFIKNYTSVMETLNESDFNNAIANFGLSGNLQEDLTTNNEQLELAKTRLEELKKLDDLDSTNTNSWIDKEIEATQLLIDKLQETIDKIIEIPEEKDIKLNVHYDYDISSFPYNELQMGYNPASVPLGSGGYGAFEQAKESILKTLGASQKLKSGGYGATFSTTINVNNNGAQISQRNIKYAADQIIDMVNNELGRRV